MKPSRRLWIQYLTCLVHIAPPTIPSDGIQLVISKMKNRGSVVSLRTLWVCDSKSCTALVAELGAGQDIGVPAFGTGQTWFWGLCYMDGRFIIINQFRSTPLAEFSTRLMVGGIAIGAFHSYKHQFRSAFVAELCARLMVGATAFWTFHSCEYM